MKYSQALEKLLSLVDSERLAGDLPPKVKFDLRRVEELMGRLGNPQLGIPCVHVAGTKGKGSTASMMASVLAAQGFRVGLYTSPHLHTFRERIQINGKPISQQAFSRLVQRLWPQIEEMNVEARLGYVSTFEMLTAMAFYHFQQTQVDFQVIEVGLGGRLDATNLVQPQVSVITSISHDHTAILGDTLEKISQEKAGIIKSGVPVVTAPQAQSVLQVFQRVCRQQGSPLIPVGDIFHWKRMGWDLAGQEFSLEHGGKSLNLWIPLLGEHQIENTANVVAALEVLRGQGFTISDEAVQRGLQQVRWPGRLEVLSRRPLVVVDGAHNRYSIRRLREALRDYFTFRNLWLVMGSSSDKDLDGMVEELISFSPQVIATSSRHPRAFPVSRIAEAFQKFGTQVTIAGTVDEAISHALEMAGPEDMVVTTGSLFTVAEAREKIKKIPAEVYPTLKTKALI